MDCGALCKILANERLVTLTKLLRYKMVKTVTIRIRIESYLYVTSVTTAVVVSKSESITDVKLSGKTLVNEETPFSDENKFSAFRISTVVEISVEF